MGSRVIILGHLTFRNLLNPCPAESRYTSLENSVEPDLQLRSVVQKHMGLNATKHVFGFWTKRDSNQSPQLERLARIVKFCL